MWGAAAATPCNVCCHAGNARRSSIASGQSKAKHYQKQHNRESNRAAGWKQQHHQATTKQYKSPENRGKEKRKEREREKKAITYTGKGGIAYEKVKEEKTRNPSWVHELWDEVLL